MKRNEIVSSHLSIVVSLSDIRREKERALSPFGPLKVGLIISQRTEQAPLEELLNILERKVTTLQSKSLEDFATSKQDMRTQLARLSNSITEEDGIK